MAEATKSADHVRTMEQQAIALQRLDILLGRLLPFVVVMSVLGFFFALAFFKNVELGVYGVGGTLAVILIAYLTGKVPTFFGRDPS